MDYVHVSHTFPPVYDNNSQILILGSFPSVKSREYGFYYGHKMNRFWKVMAYVFDNQVPETIEEKKKILLSNRVALWDVIESCDIKGSSDSSIKNVIPADIKKLLNTVPIKRVYANGHTAFKLYKKYIYDDTKKEIELLPSTSPANAGWSFDKLKNEYKKVLNTNDKV